MAGSRGAGWRLDSAWSAPASFWRPVLTEVRRRHPGAWLLGQVFDDDLPGVVNGTPYSAATEYALMHGVRAWLAGGPAESIVSALQLHGRNCGRSRIVHTFIGNHDFARIADVVGAQRVAAALAIMLTLPGLPAIYYGDEYGLGSSWTSGGDDALLRPPLRPDDAQVTTPAARRVWTEVRELTRLRRDHPWIADSAVTDVSATDNLLTYRISADNNTLDVWINRGTSAIDTGQLSVPPNAWAVSAPKA